MSTNGIVIIGNGALSKALLRTVQLFADSAKLVYPETVWQLAARITRDDDQSDNFAQVANDLMDCRLAMAVAEGPNAARQVINLLRILREHWLADAGFVALVDSKTEFESLQDWDVFGDPSGRFTFRRELQQGHEAFCVPFKLADLLHRVVHPNTLPSNGLWTMKWSSQSLAAQTSGLLDEAGELLKIGEISRARDKFLTAICQARELNWNALVDHVRYRKHVEPFLRKSFDKRTVAKELANSIVELQQCFSSVEK